MADLAPPARLGRTIPGKEVHGAIDDRCLDASSAICQHCGQTAEGAGRGIVMQPVNTPFHRFKNHAFYSNCKNTLTARD